MAKKSKKHLITMEISAFWSDFVQNRVFLRHFEIKHKKNARVERLFICKHNTMRRFLLFQNYRSKLDLYDKASLRANVLYGTNVALLLLDRSQL